MAVSSRKASERRPLRRLGLGILIACGLALVLAQTAPQIAALAVPVRTSVGDQIASNSRPSLWARITGQSARERRIRELEQDIRDLSRWKAAAISMVERMETYEAILNLQGEPPAKGLTARIASESDGPFSETLLANAGRAQGVEPGFVAVNEAGLIGRVIEVGAQSSRILLVTDFNSRTPVLGEVSGVRAIMHGGRDGAGELVDLPEQDVFIAGERILTSGEGGVFPRGILAGHAVLQPSRGWRVALALHEGQSGFVRLLPPITIPKPGFEPPAAEGPVRVNAGTGGGAAPSAGQ